MFNKKTIHNADLSGKRVLARVDYNVPLNSAGEVMDDFRIKASLPTLQYLVDNKCKITLISHLGRPKGGRYEPQFSLRGVAETLQTMVDTTVHFAGDLTGEVALRMSHDLGPGEILVLDNLRFHDGEAMNDERFASQLTAYGEIFVQDGFGVAHRKAASTDAITRLMPSYSGLLLEQEVSKILEATQHPDRPLLAIIGGAKIDTKLDLLDEFIDIADEIVVGGAMANTFIHHAKFGGHNVGQSLVDDNEDEVISRIFNTLQECGKKFILPYRDVAVGYSTDDENRREIDHKDVQDGDMILDFGRGSLDWVIEAINRASTIIWNGPLGYFENPSFSYGSSTVAQAISESDAYSVVGGGDTDELLSELNLKEKFNHVSTGGGAALELLAGKKLPGVEALLDK